MSNQVMGKFKTKSDPVPIIGTPAVLGEVSVDILSYKNRQTCAKTIAKNLEGGFQYPLWELPTVAELPDGKQLLFDGDHRRHMYKITFPEKQKMKVRIVKVSSKKEISKYWSALNKRNTKTATRNEVFVNDCNFGDKDSMALAASMEKCSLSVSLMTGEPDTTVGATSGKNSKEMVTVQASAFKRLLKYTDENSMMSASHLVQDTYPDIEKMPPDLFRPLAHLFHKIPELSPTADKGRIKVSELFANWFVGTSAALESGGLVTLIKGYQPSKSAKLQAHVRPYSLAIGIITAFRKSPIGKKHNQTITNFFRPATKEFKEKIGL